MALIFSLTFLNVMLSAAQVQGNTYVVQPDDTLSEIAESHGISAEDLRILNGLGSADLIWVGLPLLLPGDADMTGSEAVQSQDSLTTLYTARSGDSLATVASLHQTSLAHLVALNRISPSSRLYPGQSLVVPAIHENETLDPSDTETRIHRVEAGEHLGVIAERYTTTARKISELNGLSNASLITPGQRLLIPPPSFDELATQAPIGPDGYHYHPEPLSFDEKWIDVDLSEQRVVAYQGEAAVAEFIISSGKENTPTVTGTFRIWAKTPVQDMFGGNRAGGDYYYLEDVEWVQYFYEDYGFHAATWHDNFGEPMSRGCINMRTDDAEWLYDWAAVDGEEADATGWIISPGKDTGTLVVVHE